MRVATKGVCVAVCAVVTSAALGLMLERRLIRKQGLEQTRNRMRSIVLGAESAAESIGKLQTSRVFDRRWLGRLLEREPDFRKSLFYQTIPMVTAMRAVSDVAAKEGFEFRVSARKPRNPANAPGEEDGRIIDLLAEGQLEEFFEADFEKEIIRYARPIRLTENCLVCHGDPRRSLNRDGNDVLGFPMENRRAGEMHGAYLLQTSTARIDQAVDEGLARTARWLAIACIPLAAAAFLFLRRSARRLAQLAGWIDGLSRGDLSREIPLEGKDEAAELAGAVNRAIRYLRVALLEVGERAANVTAASVRMASSTKALAAAAQKHASGYGQSPDGLQALNDSLKRNAESAREANQFVDASRETAQRGEAVVRNAVAAMAEINSSSRRIADIISVIDEIAFQTNLLALNAAVEAARAGEQGRGFAIVANEVHALAHRSAQAAREIKSLIEDSVSKVETGSKLVDESGEVLRQLLGGVNEVAAILATIADASRHQSGGFADVGKTTEQFRKFTHSYAGHALKLHGAARDLHSHAEAVQEAAGRLKLED